MEKEEYPRTAITLEFILGLVFGVMGIGHIYAGYLFSGVIILLAHFALIFLEYSAFFIFTIITLGFGGLFGFLPFILLVVVQNVIFATISAYAIKKHASEFLARIFLAISTLMGGIILLLFFQAGHNREYGLACLFASLVACFLIMFLGSKEEEPDEYRILEK
jgi:hypothetical protein